jgi:hypothetical protein
MSTLDKTGWEILNATADDWENLEHIYHAICFEVATENNEGPDSGATYLRPAKGAPLLQEIADRTCELVESGLLEARLELEGSGLDLRDRSYVWRGWFTMSPQGRSAWSASKHTALV